MAATQTTNNNSIRSILAKEKLNGSNFLDWYRNLRIVLRNEQKLHHLEEALPEAPTATAHVVVRNAYTRRVAKQQEVACLMLMERLGYPIPLVLEVNMILTSLSKDYDQFVQNYNMHGMRKTIPELHAMLKLAKKGIPKKTPSILVISQGQIQKPKSQTRDKGKQRGNEKSKLAYDPKHKIPPPAKKEHLAKDTKLHLAHQGLRGYQKLNKRALALYVSNGNTAAIEAIRSFDLILPSRMILMGRKPFIQEVKELMIYLESYIDVCGSFRTTSREGANYYVTFTDDFENQLGKTIKALQSDQEGEYLSQGLLDHLRSRGIILQLTPPYTPQHNGVSKRRNRTLLDMVRPMMSLTTLLMSFWGYALESAACILNMVPTKKVNKTPYEIWHGKVLICVI
ncbi:retrotransposon protein, putative, ty1-copia subclass [Tanacetum coccineum]